MSFSSEVKKMAAAQPDKPCCRAAQLYGMLEMGHAFSPPLSPCRRKIRRWRRAMRRCSTRCALSRSRRCRGLSKRVGFYIVTVRHAEDRLRVMERFGHGPGELNLRLNRANLDCEGCAAAYLRGAFLSCGRINELIDTAVSQGAASVAITDHGVHVRRGGFL